ncbi:[protein-PII] uridylyltransferase [Parahalioglobus pacificus]|uniref:Bifunctional uridylyltransferase/uridylyl-removing enzyme n=1 Tax=Parahalioglobus pacificus TaxID=930806 RepID=A0A918XIQ6_9GAMM|nr:[protein-PII] uridylyltransferase [Halioglobus pacificus]NQY02943.1 [protein-PII] uridylyltransferase [Halieaceae bacterium]GHD32452.1 bifunctional uridylyltransferase/uridylyl-removing enzyme [Halioglobus pacificus]
MQIATPLLPKSLFDPEAFSAELAGGHAISACKAAIADVTEALHAQFREGQDINQLIALRAAFIDGLLGSLWDQNDWQGQAVSLVAVGGYGRGELHPHSDIDILLLMGADCQGCEEALSGFLTLLWDIGLDVGHSVRTVDECEAAAREDITILTNLMEARVIRGPNQLMDAVSRRIAPDAMWPSADFFSAKLAEQEARHEKYADTEYSLEPNVKSSPGGLRDLQIIGWIAERHFGVDSLDTLEDERFLDAEEREILYRGREFMWRVRYALHMITGREEDRLLFDHQRELANLWGFVDGERLAVEQFMHTYYRWALSLGRLNEVIIQYFSQSILRQQGRETESQINDRFLIRNNYLEVSDDQVFEREPSALLETFLLLGTHENIIGVGAHTIRLIRNHRHLVDDAFRDDPRNHQLFLEILRAPFRMTRQLRRMTRYGILDLYLPEFGAIVGQMQFDLFHTYTVDAHTLQVVQNMRNFLKPAYDERFPVTSRVARRLPKMELLYIAGLYHDIGKGRGGDHSELGAVDARLFCARHGLNEEDTDLIAWLVENHLVMSNVAQRKDISDPDVILQFANHVGDQDHLDYLFTLTVADINGTNPTLWNAWRGSLLRQLYTETRRALRRGLENPVEREEVIAQTREAAERLLEYRGFTSDELDELWAERGDDYFLRERAEDIAWHTEAIADHFDTEKSLVLVRNTTDSSVANTTQIFVHAKDKAQRFSRACASLEQMDLSIHDARIYSANDGMTLDTFFVLDSDGQSIAEDSVRLRFIQDQLTEDLNADKLDAPPPQRRTPRKVRSFTMPVETRMHLDEHKNVTVLEVAAPDRPGLLARISQIFVDFGVELQAAKIQTLGERVEDVFFITDSDNQPLANESLCEDIQSAIRNELTEEQAA